MKYSLLEKIQKEFDVPAKGLKLVAAALGKEMDAGLAARKSSLAMLPAFCDAATGHEKGMFLALDLGGTNFRVMMVRVAGKGGKNAVLAEAKYKLTTQQISSDGVTLFNAIAKYVGKFLKDNRFAGEYGLGYTFSFPVKLVGIDEGILMRWTKDFTARGVVGKKVVALQKQAFDRQGVRGVRVAALANDTVGTLQAQAVLDPNCVMGVILGTGFNICVRLSSKMIRKDKGGFAGRHMIINMEAGGFDKALPLTAYDCCVDAESENQGGQLAEKMISGKYLPQLARLGILELISNDHLFDGRVPAMLRGKDGWSGLEMGILEAGAPSEVKKLGQAMLGRALTKSERAVLAGVCHAVTRRSARIAAAMIAGSLSRVDRKKAARVTVAVDGSLFEKYPGYGRMMEEGLRELKVGRVALKLTKDGSGIGAAVIAAVVEDGLR